MRNLSAFLSVAMLLPACATQSTPTTGDDVVDPGPVEPPDLEPVLATSPGTATVASSSCDHGVGRLPSTTCQTLTIACPDIDDMNVEVRITEPPAGVTARGTIIFGSGGGGRGFSYDQGSIMDTLRGEGFRLVQRGWAADWMANAQGNGLVAANCRYATLAHWVADNVSHDEALCATGNSGGAAELGQAITRYSLDDILDQAVPTSGPGIARVDSACLVDTEWQETCDQLGEQSSTNPACSYSDNGLDALLDEAYAPATPCGDWDAEATTALYDDSSLGTGADLEIRNMRLDILLGGRDSMVTFAQGLTYADGVHAGTGGSVSVEVIAAAPHAIPDDASPALATLVEDLVEGCVRRH